MSARSLNPSRILSTRVPADVEARIVEAAAAYGWPRCRYVAEVMRMLHPAVEARTS